MAATCHIRLSKLKNLNLRQALGTNVHHLAKFKSVKRLQSYGDLTVFKMEAVRRLGFLKFNFLTV